MGTEVFTGVPNDLAASTGSLQTLQAASLKLRLEDTKYTFEQLTSWLLQIAALNLDGVMIYDANEGKNNVYLGVETKAQAEAAKARIAKLSLPNDAVEMQVVGPYRDLVLQNKELQEDVVQQKEEATSTIPKAAVVERDVTGYVNPPVGGAEIVVRGSGFSGTCTYGFSAKRNGVTGFISNGHCTRYKNSVDGTEVFQGGSKIGFELVDPNARGCGIIWNICRYSDAAFFKNTGTRIVIPRIAGTGPDPYDKTYTYTSKVNGIRNSPAQYEAFIVVTSQTGFTRLIVTNTCTYLKTYGSSSTVECGAVGVPQSGYPGIRGGDSGSPVITRNASGAVIVGEIFADNPLAGTIWMNIGSGILRDLGPLTVTW